MFWAGLSTAAALYCAWHHVSGCPGARVLVKFRDWEHSFAEWLEASDAREKRAQERTRRFTRAAAQIERHSRAKAEREERQHEPEQQRGAVPAVDQEDLQEVTPDAVMAAINLARTHHG